VPEVVKTDRGPQRAALCSKLGIKHKKTTAYKPKAKNNKKG
jgi:hypothetical protein